MAIIVVIYTLTKASMDNYDPRCNKNPFLKQGWKQNQSEAKWNLREFVHSLVPMSIQKPSLSPRELYTMWNPLKYGPCTTSWLSFMPLAPSQITFWQFTCWKKIRRKTFLGSNNALFFFLSLKASKAKKRYLWRMCNLIFPKKWILRLIWNWNTC